jgi:hypothetical protein
MTTAIANLTDLKEASDQSDQFEPVSDDDLLVSVSDLSLPIETRIDAVNRIYAQQGDNIIEVLNRLSSMYEINGITLLKDYLYSICEKANIPVFYKSIVAVALLSKEIGQELGFKAINDLYVQFDDKTSTTYRIEMLKHLSKSPIYKDNIILYLTQIINNNKLECLYRYKTILSFTNWDEEEKRPEYVDHIIKEVMIQFFHNTYNITEYRILAAQYLLQAGVNPELQNNIEKVLLGFGRDTALDYNIRADAIDVVLKFSVSQNKKEAEVLILTLGTNNKKITNIYANAQNVHTKEIEASISSIIEFLHSFDIARIKDAPITFEYVKKRISLFIKTCKDQFPADVENKLEVAFTRISVDKALYSQYNCTIENILLRVWTYIKGNKHEKEMKKRLVEELYEMSGTCSTGFATRMCNAIAGFDKLSIQISWRDQIIANLTGRLNARIRDMDNLTLQENVLVEMTMETEDMQARKHFLKFFRQNISEIRNEMWEEFKNHITDTDYDLYFRAGIAMYETGNKYII